MRARAALLLVLLFAAATACGDDDGPTRVLLVGDSVMGQVAPDLIRDLEGDDVTDAAVAGSGLLTPDFVDWPTELRALLREHHPDEVIFLFVGNYELAPGQEYTTADGHTIPSRRDPTFARAWQAQAQRMTDAAEDAGADVVWVLPPPMRARIDQQVVDELRDGYEQLGTATIDSYDALADDDGGFVADLRNPDGVHLNPAGARALAALIADQQ
jgi:hypothetical protein